MQAARWLGALAVVLWGCAGGGEPDWVAKDEACKAERADFAESRDSGSPELWECNCTYSDGPERLDVLFWAHEPCDPRAQGTVSAVAYSEHLCEAQTDRDCYCNSEFCRKTTSGWCACSEP